MFGIQNYASFISAIISLLYQVGLVLVGNVVAQKLKALPLARKVVTKLAGIALIGFGIKLAANNR